MAWTFINEGGGSFKAAGSTLGWTAEFTSNVNEVLVVVVAVDNIATINGDQGDIVSVTDSSGNTYTKARQRTNGQGAAAAGASSAIYFSKLTATVTKTTSSLTITFNGTPVAKALDVMHFSINPANTVSVAAQVDGSPESATTVPVASITGLVNREYLFIASTAVEGPSTDTYTEAANYTAVSPRRGTSGGAATTNMTANGARRIFTGTGDTYNPTLGTARDLAQVYVALLESGGVVTSTVTPRSLPLCGVGA